MNKKIISIIAMSLVLTGGSVFAHEDNESNGRNGMMKKGTSTYSVMYDKEGKDDKYKSMPSFARATTGDPVIDAELKALNTEMEAKLKAIHEEYLAKFKVIVGDHKLIRGKGEPRVASSTVREYMEDLRASTTKGYLMMRRGGENDSNDEDNRPGMRIGLLQDRPSDSKIVNFFKDLFRGSKE
ncbi:hypothetical protein K9M47_02455 [Candidatus Gracilibacteria bacterium]|nr:hypothetical protein [Candidatus Gracilibacteria bacterium]MCF7898887.1 hypothetical protein [Candidatus Paceibacterota bacterium]